MSGVDPVGLGAVVAAWIADDPDAADRDELSGLLAAAGHDRLALEELVDRFAGPLRFGTAGLRAPVGAGPARLNRAVVRAATAGLSSWLLANVPDAARMGVVVGCDARHRSVDLWNETAGVLAGAGITAHVLEPQQPTPLLAFATRWLGAAAGVMITASHNPAADNGYKLYLGDGAQIVTPVDRQVEAAIATVGPLVDVPVAASDHPLVRPVGGEVVDAYVDAVTAGAMAPPGASQLRIVHTALHGVATRLFDMAVARGGYPPAHHVRAQAEPNADFPTVTFPNPEEPGALDMALDEARRIDADIVIANDPDGDRLAVAVPDPEAAGGWRAMSGDHLGAVLGAAVIAGEVGPGGLRTGRVVASSIVSSTLLGDVASAAGVQWVETLTGFKWIVRAATAIPGGRLVYGYEEALGYVVGDAVRDKDGIGAALAVLALAVADRSGGRSMLDRLDDLERRHGVHATRQVTRRLPSLAAAAAAIAGVRRAPPTDLASMPVLSVEDLADGGRLPPADVVILTLTGARVILRPSGTEPKLKAYLEVVEAPTLQVTEARRRAEAVLDRLADAVGALLDGGAGVAEEVTVGGEQ